MKFRFNRLHLIAILGVALLGQPAVADDKGTAPEQHEVDKADPASMTLPSVASEIAKANAFGQQGERMRAIHQAVRAAAAQEAAKAARDAASARRDNSARGTAAAALRSENARRGLDRAAAAGAPISGIPRP
ncbi:MAG TPA: hypothetical protein VML75_11195 [Kofleriaceae bacterium]|nr:hypothetical protein [Kofleriaceae bacterium]